MMCDITATPMPIENCLETGSLFAKWENPETGIRGYILNGVDMPLAQTFYFVNSGFIGDGRYLWFYTAQPPGPRKLGVVDFHEDRVDLLHDTEFLDASPMVHPATGEAYWFSGCNLLQRSPRPHDVPRLVNQFPLELVRGRTPKRIATHLTLRADGLAVNVDAELQPDWYIGEMPLDGGSTVIWRTFDQCYNHSQFSPTDPNLQLVAQDGWRDQRTGRMRDYTHRLWLVRRDGWAEPLYAHPTPKHGHEWWDPDGRHVWYVHYGAGVERVDIVTRQTEMIWPHPVSHAHATINGHYLIGDLGSSGQAPFCRVVFHNRLTGRNVTLVDQSWIGGDLWRYHVHPHPRFVLGDRYVCYTTFASGRIDVALTPTKQLIAATR